MTKLPNIMGFELQHHARQRRLKLWGVVIGVLLGVLLLLGLIQYVVGRNYGDLSGFKSILTQNITNTRIQNSVLTLISNRRSTRTVDDKDLISLYDSRYDEYCVGAYSDGGVQNYCALSGSRDEILSYLGYTQPRSYLILLQNSAEVRPNGGFYGSFVRVTLGSGMIQNLSIHDSYEVPFINSGIALALPQWTDNYLGDNEATFIAGNKFGFTARDGRVISAIYNKTYNTSTDGVIFISTDTLTTLVPSMQDQLRRWQFVNAAVDLIRGHDGGFKKQLYIQQITSYLQTNKLYLLGQLLENFSLLNQQGMMQLYLPEASTQLQSVIFNLNRTTELKSEHFYLRDINQAYNKIDTFVIKRAWIQDLQGEILVESQGDIINAENLVAGQYQLIIDYQLMLPLYYVRTMALLEEEYEVSLTERERHILGLDEVFEYSSVVFAGSGITMESISGDGDKTSIFDAPPAQGAAYHILGTGNRTIQIGFTKL